MCIAKYLPVDLKNYRFQIPEIIHFGEDFLMTHLLLSQNITAV